jgi:BirA family biotin operon repressor/biotin-[acetyl-CoA-carboxylase] ligase
VSATAPALGRPRVHHRVTDSTNERAKELALAGAPHGTLVTADEQASGRGRQGRSWHAAPRVAVLASVLVRGLDERHAVLPLAAAVAVADACEEAAPVTCEIKWPNDVWIERRKVAGILIEGRPDERWAVIGVGINVSAGAGDFPDELRDSATSLALATEGEGPAVDRVLGALLDALTLHLEEGSESVLARWRARDALRGQPVSWPDGSGTAAGVDKGGALLVDTAEGRVKLDAGEVHLRS